MINEKSRKIITMGKRVNLTTIKKSDLKTLQKWRNSKDIWPYSTQYSLLNMNNQKKMVDVAKLSECGCECLCAFERGRRVIERSPLGNFAWCSGASEEEPEP